MNESIFGHLDYRDTIKEFSKEKGINYKSLASSARIHTSYFSRVMQNKAYFSKEQLFLIANDFKLSSEQTDFFLLLGEYDSSSLETHRSYLLKKIKKTQQEKSKLVNKLTAQTNELSSKDVNIYYQESVTAKIHILLTIDKYKLNPNLICKKILISETKLNQELKKLINLKIIKYVNGIIKVIKNSVHLEEAHQASLQNHINWRLETVNHLIKRNANPTDYHLSAVFSCDQNAKNEIKVQFKKFIVEVQKIVQKSTNNDDAYFLGLDLF